MRSRIGAPRSSRNSLEQRYARALEAVGVEFDRNVKRLPGSPDFVAGKVALFVHGCYWHGCAAHARPSSREFSAWSERVQKEASRFARADRELRALGFSVLVAWEHDDPIAFAGIVSSSVARRAIGVHRLDL